jgi:hypothetical protein
MDKNRFNRDVRPQLCVIPIGAQGIAFDRVDLDAWVDEYKNRNGRPAYLAKRVMELREVKLFGARRERTFRAAATKFLEENQHKRSLERDARALAILDPYIGDLPLRRVHHDTLQPYVRSRLASGISPGTINRDLAVVRRILNLCVRLWRDESDRPWLDTAPLIQMQRHPDKREPYPLSIEEQRLLFSELDGHLASMVDGAVQGEHRPSRTRGRESALELGGAGVEANTPSSSSPARVGP